MTRLELFIAPELLRRLSGSEKTHKKKAFSEKCKQKAKAAHEETP